MSLPSGVRPCNKVSDQGLAQTAVSRVSPSRLMLFLSISCLIRGSIDTFLEHRWLVSVTSSCKDAKKRAKQEVLYPLFEPVTPHKVRSS